jgi:hypothetical protein
LGSPKNSRRSRSTSAILSLASMGPRG